MRAKFYYLQRYAHEMLTLAIYHGDLVPTTNCEKCGAPDNGRQLHGHHEDYSKPLEVTWLCNTCHRLEHNRDGEYNFAPKLQVAIQWLRSNPDKLTMSCRDLVQHIGVSYVTIYKAQKVLYKEASTE